MAQLPRPSLRHLRGPTAPLLLSFAAAILLVGSGALQPMRQYLARWSSLRLDELCVLALLPLAGLLFVSWCSRRALRAAATHREAERDAARTLASRDPLTGLLNRRGLDETLRDLSPALRRVFLIDIDSFKAVNDDHGHACGDGFLENLAARLHDLVNVHGIIAARLGGDEFVLVAEHCPQLIAKIDLELMQPLRSKTAGSLTLTLSVGGADFDDRGFANALERADLTMYEMKRGHSSPGLENNRLFELQLAAQPEPDQGYGVIAIAVNRLDGNGRPLSYSQAGPLTRAVFTAIQDRLPELTIERLSNDMLGVVTPIQKLEEVTSALQRIDACCVMDNVTHRARLTFGRAGPAQRLELRETVEQAQLAVERARRSGRDIVNFEESDRIAMRANAALLRDLRVAIASNQLDLHFQPKLNLRTNTIDTLEALVRWTHPVRGPIGPAQFIPLTEESGDIRALTDWVFDAACKASITLKRRGLSQPIFVNVSAPLIAEESFVSGLISTVRATGARIGIEVTETGCLQQPHRALANLKRLADAGMNIAIDDYGVGLSSLTYLRQMPASELKIDMSFIRDLSESHRDPLIVRSTIDLAHSLGLRVTAEGVDKAETMALLKIMGCDFVQGFHIGPAVPLLQCADLLLNWVLPEVELPDYAAILQSFAEPAGHRA